MSQPVSRRTFLGASGVAAATVALPSTSSAILGRGASRPAAVSSSNGLRAVNRAMELMLGGDRHPRRRGGRRQDSGARSGRQLGGLRRPPERGRRGSAGRLLHARSHQAGGRGCRAGGDQDPERGGPAGAQVHRSHPAGRRGSQALRALLWLQGGGSADTGVPAALAHLARQSGPGTTTGSTCRTRSRSSRGPPARSTSTW